MGTQQIVDFDMEITLTAQQRRVYPFTFKCNYKREDDIFTIASLLPMNVYVLIVFQIMTRAFLRCAR